jgi:uncharacterized repeat protein (TIGR01451 family)
MWVATDLAMISGRVFDDVTGNGFNPGEELAGVSLTLHRDNGDGIFQQTNDLQVSPATTGVDGRYQFSRLTAGGYFVLQDAQSIGGASLLRTVSPLITISPMAVEGRIVRVIDNFDTTRQVVVDSTNDGVPVTSSIAAPEAIGGERDLFVNKTSVNGSVQLSVDDPLLPNLLIFDSAATGDGQRRVTWDGPDGSALTVADTGLGMVDLTSMGDALGVQLQIGADQPGINAVVRLYSDDGAGGTANRFSTATLPIPQTGGSVPFLAEFIPFSSFTATSGGGAGINNIGAIELEITGTPNVNGSAELVGSVGQTIFTQDFANFESADLRLVKAVNNATPNVGQNVTFTITLSNDGPQSASGVAVRDSLPEGIAFVSATPSQGTYSNATGIWTVGTVASGGSAVLSLVARPTVAAARVNTAEVSAADQFDPNSTPGNGVASENDQDSVTLQAVQIDLSLVKSASPAQVIVGQNVTFLLSLANAGPSAATGVVVRDLLPAGVSFVSSSASQGSYVAGTGLWTVGSVPVGAAPTLSIVGRVDTPGNKTNTAEVSAADQPDLDSTPGNSVATEDDQDSETIGAPQIDLSLSKTVDNAMPEVGENVTFTLLVSNLGPDTATGVRIRDLLPAGLTFVSSATASGSYDNGTGIWNVGSVAASGSAMLTITATPATTEMITNTAEVIAADQPDADSTPGNGVASEDDQRSVTIGARQIDLSLSKSVDRARPNVGETIAFEITVTNAGPSNATGVTVRDVLPSGLTFVSAAPSVGGYNASTGQWTVGNLASGASQTLVLRARVAAATVTTNTAEVIAADPVDIDSTPNNGVADEDDQDSITVSPLSADLSLAKEVDNPQPNVGQNATFTITVRNGGPDDATNVSVRDQLPAGITFVSSDPSQGSYVAATGIWSVGSIAASGQASLRLVGRIDTIGSKTNTAQVSAVDQFDPDSSPGNSLASEDDQASVSVDPPVIDLSLNKQIDVARPNLGQTVRFTIVVANAGPSTASGVIVADQLPSGVSFVSSSPSIGSYDAISGRWNVGGITAGSMATLLIDATVNSVETTVNTAEVFAADQFDVDSTPGNSNPNEDDQRSVSFVAARSDLSLNKTVDDDTPNVGQNVSFTIVVTNAGPDPASGVSVLDRLPPGLTFVSSAPQVGSYSQATGIWTIGGLAVGGTATLTLVATSTTTQAVTNTAEVQTSDQLDPNSMPGNGVPAENDQDSVEVRGQQIDLSLSKTVDNERPNVGAQVRFTLTVTNAGPSQATGVSVRDMLPAGLTFVSSSASQGSYSASNGTWNVGSLADDGTATLQLVARVDQILSVENVAEVITANQPDLDSTPGNSVPSEDDQDSVSVTARVADLSLTKTAGNDRPNVGEQVTFTLVLRNDGPDEANGVQVIDQLPDGLLFVSANPSQGDYNSLSGIWPAGRIASRATAMLEIVAEVLTIGVKTNLAEVIAVAEADPDSTPSNGLASEDDQDSAAIDPPVIDLSLEKSANPLRPAVGTSLTFTITLRNAGPDRASGIVVRDQLPAGTTFVSATPSAGTFDPLSGNWSVPGLAAGSTATLQLLTTVDEPGQPVNRAQVIDADQFDSDSTPANDDGIDGNGNDEDDQASVTVTTASADLSLTKSVNNDRPGVGSPVTFTLRAVNDGPDAANNVIIEDLLPAGLSFISSTPSAGSYNPASGRWTIPSLLTATPQTLRIVARVDTFGEKINTAEIVASSQFDPDSTPDNGNPAEDDQDSLTLTPQLVDLALSKIVDDETPNVGDIIRFTLEVTNAGPSTASGVQVTDRLPAGLSVRGVQPTQGVYNPVTGLWSVGTVAIGARPRLLIDAVVDTPGMKTNTAEITGAEQPDIDSTPGNGLASEDDLDSVGVLPQQADLELTQTVNNIRPNQAEQLIFTLVVENRGPDSATNVVVRDQLPDGLDFVRSTQTVGTYDPLAGLWTIPAVPARSTQMLQLIALVDSAVALNNVAELTASDQFDPDSTPDNQVSTEDDIDSQMIVPRMIDVSVATAIDNPAPNPGTVVQMVFSVRNDGPDDATGLALRVSVPSGLTVLSSTPERGTFASGIWTVGNLAVGESVDLIITARADTRGTKAVPIQVISHAQADVDSRPNNNEPGEDDQATLLVLVPLYSKRLFLVSSR